MLRPDRGQAMERTDREGCSSLLLAYSAMSGKRKGQVGDNDPISSEGGDGDCSFLPAGLGSYHRWTENSPPFVHDSFPYPQLKSPLILLYHCY